LALIVDSQQWRLLEDHAREGYPHEVVGILAGERASGRVDRVVPLLNERADSPQNRYHVGPLTLFRAEEALAAEGFEVVGYYHTHPDHPSGYSEFDRDHALPNMSYLILSVREGEPERSQSWRLREDRGAMDEEPIHVLERR
jgi:proteasome lid subunit RPN8/RPN11